MSVSIKPWTWARVGQLFRMGFRMRWLSTCSSTNRIACSSAARGTEAHGLLWYLKIGRKRSAYLIERMFGISPDGGDGSTELMILAALMLIAVLVTWHFLYIKSQL